MAKSTPRSLLSHIEEQIVAGHLPAGARLPSERQLAERFGVSRPVVREVLRGLVERNLVEVHPGRGAFVHSVEPSDAARPLELLVRRGPATARHVVEARVMLECEAASLAAVRAQTADLEAMAWALEEFEQASGLIEKARYDIGFHISIVRAARNPVIETMFLSISALTLELMLRSLGDASVARAGVPFHRDIFEGVREGDSDRARTAMAGHLSVAERLFGEDIDRSLDSVARRQLGHLLAPNMTLEALLAAAMPISRERGASQWPSVLQTEEESANG